MNHRPASNSALPSPKVQDLTRLYPRLSLALAGVRGAALISRLSGRGGTSLPGLLGLRLDPQLVARLACQLGGGSIAVTGTNGKTTTSALLAEALSAGNHTTLHNSTGSNMLRGIATTLGKRAALSGRIRSARSVTGLFEVDEAALPRVLEQVRPRLVLITNLFRDQLDRYGELATVAEKWRASLTAQQDTTLVLNADDSLVASLAASAGGNVVFYGIESWPEVSGSEHTMPALSADSIYCPTCGVALRFQRIAYAHLGQYTCPACGLTRPTPQVRADVRAVGGDSADLVVRYQGLSEVLHLTLPGRYNVYNAVAAIAAAVVAGVSLHDAARAVERAKGSFGRAEQISVAGRTVRIFLVKNPTGADEVLRVLVAGERSGGLLALLNDNAADGHDVSWIWDANFDLLAGWEGPIYCGGTRAEDMALRLKYAGVPAPALTVPQQITGVLRCALAATPAGGTLTVLATYTAMLAARDALAREGHVAQYWRRAG